MRWFLCSDIYIVCVCFAHNRKLKSEIAEMKIVHHTENNTTEDPKAVSAAENTVMLTRNAPRYVVVLSACVMNCAMCVVRSSCLSLEIGSIKCE